MSNFIYEVIKEINQDKWYGVSDDIEICKGKNKLNMTLKERLEQFKRMVLIIKNNNK